MKKNITWILVADGARATILRSEGWGSGLQAVQSERAPSAAVRTREMGTERPGRVHDRHGGGRHGMEPSIDWQRYEKHKFAKKMAEILDCGAKSRSYDRLVLVAPPKVLGDLRAVLGKSTRRLVTAELDKDLTHLPVADLAGHLEKVTPV